MVENTVADVEMTG